MDTAKIKTYYRTTCLDGTNKEFEIKSCLLQPTQEKKLIVNFPKLEDSNLSTKIYFF